MLEILLITFWFVCSFVPSLSSCHDKATVALYFGRICARLWNCHISEFSGCFSDFLPLNLLLVRSHQAEIIIVKRLIQGRNNVCDEGPLDHAADTWFSVSSLQSIF